MAELQSISDRLEIRELADRYTVGVTCRDWELVASCYHEDARWHASVGYDFKGREALVAGIRSIVEANKFQLQMHHAISIDSLTSDSATARSVLHEVLGGEGKGLQILGVYNDRIGKFDGEWLFVERYFDVHYHDPSLPGQNVVDYGKLPKF